MNDVEKLLWNTQGVFIKSEDPSLDNQYNTINHCKIELIENIDTILEENCANDSSVINLEKLDTSESDTDSSEDEKLSKSKRTRRKVSKEINMEVDNETSKKLPSCNQCNRTFSTMNSMRDHMRAIHQKLEEADMFKCTYCSQLFKMKYYLSKANI